MYSTWSSSSISQKKERKKEDFSGSRDASAGSSGALSLSIMHGDLGTFTDGDPEAAGACDKIKIAMTAKMEEGAEIDLHFLKNI